MYNKEVQTRLDTILLKMVGMSENLIDEAKEKDIFNKDIAEGISIVLSMAYGRWCNSGNKQID